MSFEELENLWSRQPPTGLALADPATLQRVIRPELRRRSRMLSYQLGMSVFVLVVLPLLTILNARYNPARYGSPAQWSYAACQLAVTIFWVVYSVRRLQRHRALQRRSTDTVQAVTALSVASLEDEMRDYGNIWRKPVCWIALASLTAALVNGGIRHGWKELAVPGALMTFGLITILSLVFWRHYCVNLRPALTRQREILRQLS
jgi:hypothetical protein